MKVLLQTVFFVSLLGFASLSPSDESDSDSTEYGVVETERSNNCTCGWANKEDERIVGGKATLENEYPMIAGMVYLEKDLIFCGGTILTPRHIVTAAHCTYPYRPEDYGIYVGHHNYAERKKEIDREELLLEPEHFYNHENFEMYTLKYDIAIILMKEPMIFTQKVGPACLPKESIDLVDQRVKVLGWGHTRYRGKTSDVLLKVNVNVKPFDTCKKRNRHLELIDRHQICTFRKKKDSCSGDSGGPLLWLDPDTNRYTLVAATSYGTNCAKHPAVNSDIYYFLPWIQSIISESDPTLRTCAKI